MQNARATPRRRPAGEEKLPRTPSAATTAPADNSDGATDDGYESPAVSLLIFTATGDLGVQISTTAQHLGFQNRFLLMPMSCVAMVQPEESPPRPAPRRDKRTYLGRMVNEMYQGMSTCCTLLHSQLIANW